jgi:hypothetical protein
MTSSGSSENSSSEDSSYKWQIVRACLDRIMQRPELYTADGAAVAKVALFRSWDDAVACATGGEVAILIDEHDQFRITRNGGPLFRQLPAGEKQITYGVSLPDMNKPKGRLIKYRALIIPTTQAVDEGVIKQSQAVLSMVHGMMS